MECTYEWSDNRMWKRQKWEDMVNMQQFNNTNVQHYPFHIYRNRYYNFYYFVFFFFFLLFLICSHLLSLISVVSTFSWNVCCSFRIANTLSFHHISFFFFSFLFSSFFLFSLNSYRWSLLRVLFEMKKKKSIYKWWYCYLQVTGKDIMRFKIYLNFVFYF